MQSELRLLCPTGGCASVDDYASCNLARVPAGALVGRAELQGSALGDAIQSAFEEAGKWSTPPHCMQLSPRVSLPAWLLVLCMHA